MDDQGDLSISRPSISGIYVSNNVYHPKPIKCQPYSSKMMASIANAILKPYLAIFIIFKQNFPENVKMVVKNESGQFRADSNLAIFDSENEPDGSEVLSIDQD